MLASLPAMTFCYVDSQVDTTKMQMTRAAERVEIYSLRKGRLPDGLAAVFDEAPRDSWGNALLYVRIGDGFELVSLGEDGRPGGSDNDEDIFYSEVH
ncbi:MAG: type II secretion system protein GspG [Alphaproteobacteria bacterium]|nr:type II secretion system protein GspG [Alphaproteobacteria bacterium]